MILKASQRSGAKALALHLMRGEENEHVTLHELRGFVSDDPIAALKEAQAIAKGTRCQQFLFSLSLSPPPNEIVLVAVFERAIAQVETRLKLSGHPRMVVFHEKDGRRHAHCVWSRIDAERMTAVNMAHFKIKLRDISRALYFEHGWKMPKGLMDSAKRDPRNFSLAEWQEAKRSGKHAGDLKEMIRECWAVSDNRAAFTAAISERGFILAKGDRRGHVAVYAEGDVLSVPRAIGIRVKDVAAKLGDPDDLPSIAEAKSAFARDLSSNFARMARQVCSNSQRRRAMLKAKQTDMVQRHKAARAALFAKQAFGARQENAIRAARLKSGLRGLWQRVTGQHKTIEVQNRQEAENAARRDNEERDALIANQLTERSPLHRQLRDLQREALGLVRSLQRDRRHYREALQRTEPEKPARQPRLSARPKRRSRRSRTQGPTPMPEP